ncbi:hypothetical protein [Thalassotalea marina]|uniref:Uncharacterized protein n=1 Tax=Thalassotalea marina TaxID=1673741 RepID=A0A919BD16_9GAMM|nr:hypothetical protein [Thalassotalea marina]GHF82523.1 hypothetical protein GCM10017161_07130 [Thalassotalea marina]
MNTKRLSLILASLVLGVGTSAYAADYKISIEQSLTQTVKSQAAQVTKQVSSALSKSIKAQLDQVLPRTAANKSILLSKTTNQSKQSSQSE